MSEDEDLDREDQVTLFASSGQKRIVEALQTVMWPSLCEKSDNDTSEPSSNSSTTTTREMADFETLFSNLANFKASATGLPDDERRKFAEKVALSFYAALGDDSDEEA